MDLPECGAPIARSLLLLIACLSLPAVCLADEICWDALRRHGAAKPEEAAQARAKALKSCDSPAHRRDGQLQKLLKRCGRLGKPDADECRIDAYRWNQWFEYPGPVSPPKDRETPAVSSYVACGCGCCGGTEPEQRCLYRSKGDDLARIVEADKKAAQDPNCQMAGCSRGVRYVFCD